jgi:hypothetical protein
LRILPLDKTQRLVAAVGDGHDEYVNANQTVDALSSASFLESELADMIVLSLPPCNNHSAWLIYSVSKPRG